MIILPEAFLPGFTCITLLKTKSFVMISFSLGELPCQIKKELPSLLTTYRLDKADNYFVQGTFGAIVLNELKEKQFTCLSCHYLIEQPGTRLHFDSNGKGLVFHFSLEGGLHFQLDGLMDTLLFKGQYQLTYSPSYKGVITFKKPGRHQSVYLFLELSLLQSLEHLYSQLPPFIQKVRDGVTTAYNTIPVSMTLEMQPLPARLLTARKEGYPAEFMEWQVAQLLLLGLEELAVRPLDGFLQMETEEDRLVKQAAAMITDRIGEYKGIRSLSLAVGLNVDKLSKNFKRIMGYTIHQYVIQARIQKAKELLRDSTFVVDQIADEVGLKSGTSLTTLFKAQTGMTPGQYREMERDKLKRPTGK